MVTEQELREYLRHHTSIRKSQEAWEYVRAFESERGEELACIALAVHAWGERECPQCGGWPTEATGECQECALIFGVVAGCLAGIGPDGKPVGGER